MNTTYDPARWAAETKLGRRIFNFNFRLTGDEMRGWELVNVAGGALQPGVVEQVYLFQQTKATREMLVRVDIVERENWRGAQARLQSTLLHCMHPDLQQGKGELSGVGDICYVGTVGNKGPVSATFLARGNLFISIASVGEEPVDVAPFTRKLDGLLSKVPREAEGTAAKSRVPYLQLKDVRAGEALTVVDSLDTMRIDGGWLKVVAPDGELRREDDRLVYVPEQPGSKRVSRFVVTQTAVD